MRESKFAIFDLDDTLFDYKATEKKAVREACIKQGIIFSDELYNAYKEANGIAKLKLPNYLLELSQFRQIRAAIFFDILGNKIACKKKFVDDYLISSSQSGVIIDGVAETIKLIFERNTYRIVVATNGSDYPRKNKLFASTIAPFIYRYYSSEMLGVAKPSKTFFEAILTDLNAVSDNVVVIGDAWETDILGAVDSQIICYWFNWKNKPIPSEMPKNVNVISRFEELQRVFI